MINTEGFRLLELKELQSMILKAMKEIHSFCVENDIEYYIIAGTMLGAVRHRGFIPWDDDIDIAMTRNNFEKFKHLFSTGKIANNYFLQDYSTDKDFGLALMRVCLPGTFQNWPAQNHLRNCKNAYIDIFPLDNVPLKEEQQRKQAKRIQTLNRICNLKLYRDYESKSFFAHFLKKTMHFLLKFISLRWLVTQKIKEMTKYDDVPCEYICSMQSHYSYSKQMISKSIYGKPTLISFEDTQFYGPEMVNDYLSHLYGDYMRLPSEDKRPKPLDTYIAI